MSLDNIELTPFLVQHLYRKSMVVVNTLQPPQTILQNAVVSFLGKNEKKILVVVNEKETAFLADADLNLLVSILSACKLSLADIALVNFDKNKSIVYNSLMLDFAPAFVLLFGINAADLQFPLHFPNYQLQQYNHQTYLSAAPLKILAQEKEQKKELWTCLQKYFLQK